MPLESVLALVDDFRTTNWLEIIDYPELVYQQSEKFLITNK